MNIIEDLITIIIKCSINFNLTNKIFIIIYIYFKYN